MTTAPAFQPRYFTEKRKGHPVGTTTITLTIHDWDEANAKGYRRFVYLTHLTGAPGSRTAWHVLEPGAPGKAARWLGNDLTLAQARACGRAALLEGKGVQK